MSNCYITNLRSQKPYLVQSQETFLDWVAKMHAHAETLAKGYSEEKEEALYKHFKALLQKAGLGPEKIATRGVFFDDFTKALHEPKDIYDFSHSPSCASLSTRTKFYDKICSKILETIYQDQQEPPSHLIHTSCTGYVSPSPAQKLISKRKWGQDTSLTHAYHMGCYGSIPSLKIARGLLHQDTDKVDIVHTEFCSLHMDPLNHGMGQLVIESLFADGAICYHVGNKINPQERGLKVLAISEEIIEDSLHGMSWETGNTSFLMTLSKDVPSLIAKATGAFVERLLQPFDLKASNCLFAIHPGGPKIVEQIAELFKLEKWQFAHTLEILKTRGNMSSATLPHVWELVVHDETIKKGQPIVSLAFGPGLTIAGVLLQKL
jgi:predicted naringenin-chalcone synthase